MPEFLIFILPFLLFDFLLDFEINLKLRNTLIAFSLIFIMFFWVLNYSIYYRNVEFLIQYLSFLCLIGFCIKSAPGLNKSLYVVFCFFYIPIFFLSIIFGSSDFYEQGDALYENEEYFITIENRLHMLDVDLYCILNKKVWGTFLYQKIGEELFHPTGFERFKIEPLLEDEIIRVTIDGKMLEFDIQ